MPFCRSLLSAGAVVLLVLALLAVRSEACALEGGTTKGGASRGSLSAADSTSDSREKEGAGSALAESKALGEGTPEPHTRAWWEAWTETNSSTLAVTVAPLRDGLRLRFGWDRQTRAAVFERAGWLWVVFDERAEVSLGDLVTPEARRLGLGGGEAVDVPRATALRFALAPELGARAKRDGTAWVVDLAPGPNEPATRLAVRVEPRTVVGPRVLLPCLDIGPVLRVDDPEVGDRLLVVPSGASGQGVSPGRGYAQFELLPTAQGVAVRPIDDGILVHALREGVQVRSLGSLYLSAPDPAGAAPLGAGDAAQASPSLLRFDDWRRDDARDFMEDKRRLLRALVAADEAQRTELRLSLARLYLANDLTADALGLLRTVRLIDPEAAERAEFRALRGAALVLTGRFEEAGADLGAPSLDGDPEASLWRAAALAGVEDWQRSAALFEEVDSLFSALPPGWRERFGLLAASAAVQTGDPARAQLRLDRILRGDPSPEIAAQVEYLRGRAFELAGEYEFALEVWEAASGQADGLLRAKATLARVELLHELDRITPRDAIARLEDLRSAWRGDPFEQALLHHLGGLYIAQGDFKAGLLALREAIEVLPASPESDAIAKEVTRALHRLFVEGGMADLPPLEAVGLYDAFGDLVAAGEGQQHVVEILAERLVEQDLLDEASAVLKRALARRLPGPEKARIGARLAEIRLLADDPQGALRGLQISETSEALLPKELRLQRRRLEARALLALGRA